MTMTKVDCRPWKSSTYSEGMDKSNALTGYAFLDFHPINGLILRHRRGISLGYDLADKFRNRADDVCFDYGLRSDVLTAYKAIGRRCGRRYVGNRRIWHLLNDGIDGGSGGSILFIVPFRFGMVN
jgi:hypothetical protein